jgi:ketosteroid isomerase-like protein
VHVNEAWERFVTALNDAQREMGAGRPEALKALWSHSDDVAIMGGFGGYERGWEQVSPRLDWASKGIAATDRSEENIVTVVGDDLAYTVVLEHMTRHAGGSPRPYTLRCTQVYRLEGGEWKITLRHADELVQKDEQQR